MDSDWAWGILTCPRCNSGGIRADGADVVCTACGCRIHGEDGVLDFLLDPHPIARREQEAVARTDSSDPTYNNRLAELLRAIDRDEQVELSGEEATAFACINHIQDARRHLVELLNRFDLERESVVLELGADHCWASGLFLDRGCKVIAADITDHLRFAPRSGDGNLFRIKADMNRLPILDESIDVVWITAAAHHSWNPGKTFGEAARVLKPGGAFFLCCEPMPSWLRFALFGFGIGFGRRERKIGVNERLRHRSKWIRLCRKAGLVPTLIFPRHSADAIEAKLRKYHLPRFLKPLAVSLAPLLQVSIHMVAGKPILGDERHAAEPVSKPLSSG
jgi:SAM-dependent methyltransferase